MAGDGLISVASKSGPEETLSRLRSEIASRGLTLFAAIDHAKGAEEAGLKLRPTAVLIFGNAKGGTPLMQAKQTLGLDLPLRALVWQDEAGKTWVSYNDPARLAQRHGAGAGAAQAVAGLSRGLEAIIKAAAEGH